MHVLVTGAAGFLGSHLTDRLLSDGHTVLGVDNLSTGDLENLAHLAGHPRFRFEERDICTSFDPGAVDYVFNLASPASPPEYLRLGIETLRVGSVGVEHTLEIAARYNAGLPARFDFRVLRRSAGTSAERELLGQREPGGPALGLRRGQALCRGDGDGLSPFARREYAPGAHLQHLRPAPASRRRAGDFELHDAGAARRAADHLRRRPADAQLLLCRRSDRGHHAPGAAATSIFR